MTLTGLAALSVDTLKKYLGGLVEQRSNNLMAPNTLLNYYWFYKLIQKANKLSKDDKND